MRLWSLHPQYLDAKGLVALWREALLAQKVLQGKTRGYRHHPQLERFKKLSNPLGGIGCYLESVYQEADARGYQFDRSKIVRKGRNIRIPVTRGQRRYEWLHLCGKLAKRDRARWIKIRGKKIPKVHPLFRVREGRVEKWEVVSSLRP